MLRWITAAYCRWISGSKPHDQRFEILGMSNRLSEHLARVPAQMEGQKEVVTEGLLLSLTGLCHCLQVCCCLPLQQLMFAHTLPSGAP